MALDRSGNDNSVDVAPSDESLRISNALDIPIQRANMLYACDIQITDCYELAAGKASEVTNQKGSSITTPKYANRDLFLHIFVADSAKLKIVVAGRGPLGAPFAKVCKIGAAERGFSACSLCRAD